MPGEVTSTFLFADLEGSTRLLLELGPDYQAVLGGYRSLVEAAVAGAGGRVVNTEGDGVFAALPTAAGALEAAVQVQTGLQRERRPKGLEVRARIGIHSGTAAQTPEGLVGLDVHRAARITAAAHGGQILISETARALAADRIDGQDLHVLELGEYVLRGLPRPERLYQLATAGLSSDFPPLRTVTLTRHNLPAQLTSFVGRDQEIAELAKLVTGARLVTVLGVGGTGKTRAALKVAEELVAEFPDGVWLVELAPLHEPSLVPQAVARALQLPDSLQGSLEQTLQSYVRGKDLLLVLDNCEHLIEPVAALVHQLLRASPALRILATSREPLALPGEVSYALEPLEVSEEAVPLFVERAEAARPGFRSGAEDGPAIRQICQRLDGLPLAIELAAAKVRFFAPAEIAHRLDHRFALLVGGSRADLPHHQTLRACLDWSYELLDEEERLASGVLSLFRGGAAAEDAEALLTEIDAPFETLLRLTDRSLVRAHHGRFEMLETVREYAHERLFESERQLEVSRAHALHFAAFAERVAAGIFGGSQLTSLARLDAEHDNLRAALGWSFQHEPLIGARVAAALGQFWFIRGHLSEGRQWVVRALAVPLEPELEAMLHIALSYLAWAQYDLDEADRSAVRAREIAASLGDHLLTGLALVMEARAVLFRRDYRRCEALLHLAIAEFETEGATRWLGDCHHWLGHIARYEGRVEDAVVAHGRARELFSAAGDLHGTGFATGAEGVDHAVLGDLPAAQEKMRAANEIHRRLGDRRGVAEGNAVLGEFLIMDPTSDTRAKSEAIALYREALPLLVELVDVRSMAASLGGVVPLLIEAGQAPDAARIWGACLQAREEVDIPDMFPSWHEQIEQALREALGSEWERYVDQGRAMDVTEAARRAAERLERMEPAS